MDCINMVVPMTPYKCGRYGHPSGRCRCKPEEVRRYHSRISDPSGELPLRRAFDTPALTARSYDRILRVAGTIADLAGSENIEVSHIAEAIQYRSYDFTGGM